MAALTAVVLAAGQGTRMRSDLPKVLHELCGRPLVGWPIAAAREAGADRIVVVDGPQRLLDGRLGDGVQTAVQPVANGTGGAVQAAAERAPVGRARSSSWPATRRSSTARLCRRSSTRTPPAAPPRRS